MSGQNEISAIILAGGKSTRMKEEKGLVYFNGKMLVEHVIDSAKKITNRIIIISANPAYRQFGLPCFEDKIKDKGALGGIYTGLVHSSTQKNLVIGCDMPFLSQRVFSGLISNREGVDVLLSEHKGKPEPLCAIYDKSCIPHFRQRLEQNQLKITDAFQGLKTRLLSFDAEDWFRGIEFANFNSEEELKHFENNIKNN